ncbi:TolC family protein [uncultured Desulfobacter sp.]|uniref:TolC family protein n=1 Tax=uncultured Desulfobacter sp. TaxID=240139 RepID=UPI002AAC0BD7|nr:TolC family protein [uncultured Desulfobacter sp.]
MSKIYVWVLALLLMVFEFASQGMCEPSYTLKQLCRMANENAETIQIAREYTYIAQQDKKRAQSVLIPGATIYGSYLNYKNDDYYTPDVNILGGKLTQSFTLNGRELIAYDVSKKNIEKAKFSEQAIRSDYIFQVAQAYIQALNSKRLVEVADAEVERLTTYRDSVSEKLTVGSVTKTALYRAQAELSKAKTDHIVALNNVQTAKAGIVRLTGVEDQFTMAPGELKEIDNYSVTFEQIKSHALENRYEIKEALKNIEVARQTVSYEKGEYWPRVELEGGYREKDITYDTETGTRGGYDTEEAYIQAQVAFTLYDGGLRRAQVRQAMARQRQAQQALSDEKKAVILESKQSFLEFNTAKSTLVNLADEVKSAQENFNAVQMQFKYGMADSIDIMDANTLLVDAQRRISNARSSYYLSILKIIYTQGDILGYLLNEK